MTKDPGYHRASRILELFVLAFSKSRNRQGKIAIKWIASAILGSAGIATVSYTSTDKSTVRTTPSQQIASTQSPTPPLAAPLPGPLPQLSSGSISTPPPAGGFAGEAIVIPDPETSNPNSPMKKKKPTMDSGPVGGGGPSRFQAAPTMPLSSLSAENPLPGNSAVENRFDEVGRRWVRVYFATDRSRLDLTGPWIPLRLWTPVAMGVLLASVMAIGIVAGVRRVIASCGAVAAMIMTAYFAQQAVLGTQTLRLLSQSTSVAFGTARHTPVESSYPLHLGCSEVTLPPNHKPGKLERPSLLRLEWKEDDRKHVTLQRVEIMESDAFFLDIQAKKKNSALVFIHGFNVKFDDALRRTAQLTADLEYNGIPVLYSWPSKGQSIAYTFDEANVGWTVPHLEAFLLDLKNKAHLDHIHVVAHSMGNRALLGVVERLGLRGSKDPVLSRVVMAAPDVDSLEFHNRFSSLLQRVATATTVYGSRNDRALRLSESIHGYDRLGLVSDHFGSRDSVDMIDTSPLDLSLLGHSYYGENPIVIDDMKAFLSSSFSASTRPWLMVDSQFATQRVVWRFADTMQPKSH